MVKIVTVHAYIYIHIGLWVVCIYQCIFTVLAWDDMFEMLRFWSSKRLHTTYEVCSDVLCTERHQLSWHSSLQWAPGGDQVPVSAGKQTAHVAQGWRWSFTSRPCEKSRAFWCCCLSRERGLPVTSAGKTLCCKYLPIRQDFAAICIRDASCMSGICVHVLNGSLEFLTQSAAGTGRVVADQADVGDGWDTRTNAMLLASLVVEATLDVMVLRAGPHSWRVCFVWLPNLHRDPGHRHQAAGAIDIVLPWMGKQAGRHSWFYFTSKQMRHPRRHCMTATPCCICDISLGMQPLGLVNSIYIQSILC